MTDRLRWRDGAREDSWLASDTVKQRPDAEEKEKEADD